MKWKLRSPSVFPASFGEAVRTALLESREVILFTSKSTSACLKKAEQFRYYRWCLRNAGFVSDVADIERDYLIRSRIGVEGEGYALYIRVEPDPIASLVANNPSLSDLPH